MSLDRTAAQNDCGVKSKWSCEDTEKEDHPVNLEKDVSHLLSADRETMEAKEPKTKAPFSSESIKSTTVLRCYTRKNQATGFCNALKGNAIGLNMLGPSKKLSEGMSTVSSSHALNKETDKNQNKCLVISSSSGPGIVVRGRRFHHANAQPAIKTAAQSNLGLLGEGKEYPVDVPKVPMDSIILMGSDGRDVTSAELEEQTYSLPNFKRRVLMKQAKDDTIPTLPESVNPKASALQDKTFTEGRTLSEFFSLCNNCGKKSEDHTKCENCRKPIPKDATRRPKQTPDSSGVGTVQARPPIHACSPNQAEGSVGVSAKTFYNKPLDIILTPVLTTKLCTARNNLLQTNGKLGLLGRTVVHGTGQVDSKKPLMNDPIVLSSDEEEEGDDNASTGSSRMDNVHSISRTTDATNLSPVLSAKPSEAVSEEAHDDNATEQSLESIRTEVESTVMLPRKARMKDKFGNPYHETVGKKRKIEIAPAQTDGLSTQAESCCESIILKCRSIRIGTFRTTVLEPVIFSLDFIKVSMGVPHESSQDIVLEASEFTKCEWCNTRVLPVLFLQLTPAACRKIRSSLNMSKEKSWFDSEATTTDERYIVLIFESLLELRAAAIFERILTEVGKKNNISNFFVSIPFFEANNRLLMFTQNLEEHKSNLSLKDSRKRNISGSAKTSMLTSPYWLISSKFELWISCSGEASPKYCLRNTIHSTDDGLESSHSSFTGPIEKLIVYPPPPSKGGISVTNEDLYCLKEGEFLNDVIIDFYLKYLVLEKIKQQDADRIHIFSSFFYKRLNQRERRGIPESAILSLPQRRHARVKTWTRHVDLFQKDFIFVPINETAHWFLAVICFPGLCNEPNPKLQNNEETQHNSSSAPAESNNNSALQEEMDSLTENSAADRQRKTHTIISTMPELSAGNNCESVESDKLHTRRCLSAAEHVLSNFNQLNAESEDHQISAQRKENGMEGKQLDALKQIEVSYADDSEDPFDFSPDQEYSQEDSNDAGSMVEDNSSESVPWGQQPSKQPCILIMDSLRGPSRTNVVKILREYLEVEWEMRKASKRSFTKDMIRGSNPRVPQQDNFSDCGVYVLQYVESFFENPIPSFELPMNLTDWFPQQQVKKKREEIRNVILKLCEEQSRGKKGQELKVAEAPS
ncbi:sentrin-specific protease 6 isoform X4 [Hypanus sabinus]|uniref:sentrin-specific protease 6 isoform X4 n=1 Tax=Hypanus sabinus TaxID=79690 RepID=UPI0028C4C599|nr:sentrin-specific protease 6 isoform X4 [Hypanus sabinus]